MKLPIIKSEVELREEWLVIGKENIDSRMVYFFQSMDFPDVIQIKISVSLTHRNPEQEAWRILGETVR